MESGVAVRGAHVRVDEEIKGLVEERRIAHRPQVFPLHGRRRRRADRQPRRIRLRRRSAGVTGDEGVGVGERLRRALLFADHRIKNPDRVLETGAQRIDPAQRFRALRVVRQLQYRIVDVASERRDGGIGL